MNEKMKRIYFWLVALCLVGSMGLSSCASDDDEDGLLDQTTIDQTLLYGYWKNDANDENWHYKSDQTGVYWDASETTEDQALSDASKTGLFSWYIDANGLMHLFYKESTSEYDTPDPDAPYFILSITSSKLHYKTSEGVQCSLTKYTK